MRIRTIISFGGCILFALTGWYIESRVRRVNNQVAESPLSFEVEQERRAALAEKRVDTTAQVPMKFDIEAKRKDVIALVDKGVKYFNSAETVEQAASAFTVSRKDFRNGELHLFLFDVEGTCLANGKYEDMIWKNYYNARDAFGSPYFQDMLETANANPKGGWLIFQSRGATEVVYVAKVSKKVGGVNRDYLLGCGYYPFSKKDAVVSLVKGAVALFNKAVEEDIPLEFIFGSYVFPGGRFTYGDLYIYVVTFDGKTLAHGERLGLIGQNVWDYQDAEGKYVNREIVEKLKASGSGVWVSYVSKGAQKETYVEKVTDNKGQDCFIACGYYPKTTYEKAENLVQKAYAYIKVGGISSAVAAFNDLDNPDFHYGELSISVFSTIFDTVNPDDSYKCLADPNEEFVGIYMYDQKDQSGQYFVREIIQKAEEAGSQGGWLTFKFNNAIKSVFVKLVETGLEKYAVCSGLYPVSKLNTMELLAKTAASLLRTSDRAKDVFASFVDPKGQFIQGDLYVFAFDKRNLCAAYGGEYELIWRDLSFMKDAYGVPLVKRYKDAAMSGADTIAIQVNGARRIAHVEKVQAFGNTFYVGSSFYA